MYPPTSAPVLSPTAAPASPADLLTAAARAVSAGSSLESVSRPFLDLLHTLTGLDSSYLTEYRESTGEQLVRFADNRGEPEIPEGAQAYWDDSLCKRAFESGQFATSDAATTFPDCSAPKDVGITTFMSVPVIGTDEKLMGTLCSASSRSVEVPSGAVEVMQMLARLIADQWEQDRRHGEAVQRADRAEERLRERATFLAEAEHKLKTPLTIVRGWSEVLAQDWPEMADEERDQAFSIMVRASHDASRQLQQLLDEARGEALSLQLDPARIELGAMITDAAVQLQGAAGSSHRVTATPGPAVSVHADREALWQALWHLGENAVKYSPEGGSIVFGHRREDDDGTVLVTIVDEGIGVPEGIDLFAPFTRGDPARVGSIPGTGLGLHIVRTLVRAMGGEVSARPLARGSEFCIVLPVLAA